VTPLLLTLFVLLAGQTPAQPAAWPMFRGPNATGKAAGSPPVEWEMEDRDGVLWSADIPGAGHSSPVVWGDHVFVTTAVSAARPGVDTTVATGRATVRDEGALQWQVIALDRRTGRRRWERTVREGQPAIGRHPKSTHANSTPATDGRHVVAYFGSEGLHAFDFDGTLLWSRDLGVIDVGYVGLPEYQWGTATSPIIHAGLVIVQADRQQGSFIAAFNVRNGHEVWRHERDDLP
jgi:outer membrane protein assembly factor BamB